MEYRTDGLERRAHRRICADEFAQWWRDLTEAQQEDVTAIALLLMEQGPKLPFPYSSGITGSKHAHMRELRVQSGGLPVPVILAFVPRRRAVLLATPLDCRRCFGPRSSFSNLLRTPLSFTQKIEN